MQFLVLSRYCGNAKDGVVIVGGGGRMRNVSIVRKTYDVEI